MGPRPPEYLQVPPSGGLRARVHVPRTSPALHPLEKLKIAARGSPSTGPLIPRTAVNPGPNDNVEVPTQSG